MTEVSLVLSGGGIRGVAHIGLLAAMQDHGINVNAISGSSAGALVGALYSSGLSVNEMLDFFRNSTLFNVLNLAVTKPGILDSARYRKLMGSVVKAEFGSLNIPLTICTTNLQTGEPVYFDKGDLITPLLASCAVPPLFSPVEIDGVVHSDGGIADNFPIDPLLIKEHGTIWGSYVIKPQHVDKDELSSMLKVSFRTSLTLMFQGNKHKFVAAKQMFFPNMHSVAPFSTSDTDKAFNIGYATAKNALEQLKENGEIT